MVDIAGFLNSPVGPKTIHFWAPIANWGLVLAALKDINKPAEMISERMTMTMIFYSTLFMRFAWRVQPRNFILFACHFANFSAQSYLLSRKLAHNKTLKKL